MVAASIVTLIVAGALAPASEIDDASLASDPAPASSPSTSVSPTPVPTTGPGPTPEETAEAAPSRSWSLKRLHRHLRRTRHRYGSAGHHPHQGPGTEDWLSGEDVLHSIVFLPGVQLDDNTARNGSPASTSV